MKPPICQLLTKGKILCGKVFPNFADTWNYIVHRSENIKGDKDLDPQSGHILVDNTDPEHPVVRWQPNDDDYKKKNRLGDAEEEIIKKRSIDYTTELLFDLCPSMSATHPELSDAEYGFYELYGFHDPSSVEFDTLGDEISSYDFVTRRTNGELKEIRYVSLSSIYLSTDSEVPAVGLSSVQRYSYTDDDGKTHKLYQLHHFDNPDQLLLNYGDLSNENNSRYKILVRDGTLKQLRYVNLSLELSADGADSEVPAVGLSSVQRYNYTDDKGEKRRTYMLYNFDKPDDDFKIEFDKANPETNTKQKFLVRDADTGLLRYADLCVDFNWISGDSEDINSGDYKSIQTYVNGHPTTIAQLYNFTVDEGHNLEIKVPDWYSYYYSGAKNFEPAGSDKNNMDVIVRNRNGGQFAVDYRLLSVEIPPFVHGDADNYIGGNLKSIDSIPNTVSPDYSYYQLHNWDYPNATRVNNDLVSGDYYNLANGFKKGDDGDDEDYFLIRNNQGVLVYKKIYAKAESDGSWDEQRIVNIENNISYYGDSITEIRGDICCIYGEISGLSSAIEGLSDDFWVKGGDYSDCYGSSIGDSSGNFAIGLDTHILTGDWDVAGDLEVGGNEIVWGNLTCNNGIYASNVYTDVISPKTGRTILIGETTDHNGNDITNVGEIKCTSIGGKNGDLKLDSDLDVNGHTIKNLDELDVQTQINVPIVNCTQVNSATGDVVNIGGSLNVTGSSIIVGGVTVTATQLQQLLALLNSSNNILNQSF